MPAISPEMSLLVAAFTLSCRGRSKSPPLTIETLRLVVMMIFPVVAVVVIVELAVAVVGPVVVGISVVIVAIVPRFSPFPWAGLPRSIQGIAFGASSLGVAPSVFFFQE